MLYRFAHKTGSYGVSVVEEDENQVLVQIEQVIKHPKQGDLHNPTSTENVFFHERKALSQFEKRYAAKSQLRTFNVEQLDYTTSLQQAITSLEEKLKEQNTPHAHKSLDNLQRLKEDYRLQYKQNFE
ncbi:kinase-associated lipoprotein B [Staphylococcus sp. ACRSN]|uniref:kinase-associated lipoprotein B n=1 Tax=Staphylococcus sp. ACRSN TaxID=2918214 RepID=UPI001EF35376|nr:kinase-associated lipoprotein B [Staphylococcus sp. ACRSN]MCG7339429.1 kinase-associated lipoprotein B [Staphylococcus sp. ACRSN]